MSDTHTKAQRSKNMSAIKSGNTMPELMVRKALHRKGYRYGLHNSNLPGSPDLSMPKYDAVVFINGCFWHSHDCALFKMPKSNIQYWVKKFKKNKQRDKRNVKDLLSIDKRVAIIWECALKGKNRLKLNTVTNRLSKWLELDIPIIEIRGK